MKRIIFIIAVILCGITAMAQEKDVTKFLGIPVDGTLMQMKYKLIGNGFKRTAHTNRLEGEFNGTECSISIATNKGKVYRLMVLEVRGTNEANIRVKFNNLVRQFEGNKKYFGLDTNYTIPEGEDISYEMNVHNKIYEATFYQKPDTANITDMILRNYEVDLDKLIGYKPVWFRIIYENGKYYIAIYYDNKLNMANGEDL